jgi:Uma2 family endonuclease
MPDSSNAATASFPEEYRYGRRQTITQNETAQPTCSYEALAPSAFLNPQEGDEFNHGMRHDAEVRRLRATFRRHYRNNPFITVLSGIPIYWADASLPRPAPDVAIVPNASDPHRPRTHFDVAQEGAQPRTIVEVTSPFLAELDLVDKLAIYAQAGVAEYFVIDSGQRAHDAPVAYRVLGYRLESGTYIPLRADAQGRLHSKTLRAWFEVAPDQQSFQVFDARSGTAIEPEPEDDELPSTAQIEGTFRAQSIASQLKL